MKYVLSFILACSIMACNNNEKNAVKTDSGYSNADFQVPNGRLTPETLWSFGRIGDIAKSPDSKRMAYTVTWFNISENKSYRDVIVQDLTTGEKKQITNSAHKESGITWRPDGKKIGYLSNKSERMQIWEMNPDGSEQTIISDIEGDISGFMYAPDMSRILFTKDVKIYANVQDKHPDLPLANARIIDDLMYRHWDHWVDGMFSHIFVATLPQESKTLITEAIDIMEGEPWESPLRPFGGMEQISWSPDGQTIAYTARKKEGIAYASSTNSDIYLYHVKKGTTKNLTEGMLGYDKNPIFSRKGDKIAWESMERDGYEADVNRLAIYDFSEDEQFIYDNSDLNVSSLEWDKSDQNIFFISDWHATSQIYRFNLFSKESYKLTEGVHDYTSVKDAGTVLIATRMSMSSPMEIYTIEPEKGMATELSYVNKPILDQLTMGKVEERWVKTSDNKEMLVWVIYPPNFDPAKKYPALLYCQGGPQGTVSQFWSFRWNFQMMASNDYIVVAPNRRGLPGFGKSWNEQISGDYGGQNIKDYLSAIDAVSKEPYVDATKLGAVGASYGGFSVYFLAGNHDKRFSAFIAHDGMFNFESMYLETEELWFPNFDIGGPFWERKNYRAQRSYRFSPHKFVDNWDTPIMVIHGGKDYRVTESQGFMAFNAAKIKGVPARLLHFPEENHWVLQAQNGILWQRSFFEWLDMWLKPKN